MKVLLLTDIPPNGDFTAGLVLDRLCRFLPTGSLCCFALLNPDLELQMTADLSGIPTSFHVKPDENWSFLPSGRLWSLVSWLGEWWIEARVLPPHVDAAVKFGRDQKVDVVWAVLQGQSIIRIALPIARSLGVPLHTHVWDAFSWWAKANRLDRWSARRIQSTFDSTIANSAACATASKPMADLYRRKYGVKAVPVIAGLDGASARRPEVAQGAGDVVTIGLAGQLYAAEAWNSLLAALNYAGWQVAGRPVQIIVVGPQQPPGLPRPEVEYRGWKTQTEVIGILADCSLLYCPYPFDPERSDVSRLSFPSKIPTYLAAGRPIIFHGPDYSSPRWYLLEAAAGVCCDSLAPSAIYNELERLVIDKKLYVAAARNAQAAFLRDFTLATMYREFATFLELPLKIGEFPVYSHGSTSEARQRALPPRPRSRSIQGVMRALFNRMHRFFTTTRHAFPSSPGFRFPSVAPSLDAPAAAGSFTLLFASIRGSFGSLVRRMPVFRGLYSEIVHLHWERRELARRLSGADKVDHGQPMKFDDLCRMADEVLSERRLPADVQATVSSLGTEPPGLHRPIPAHEAEPADLLRMVISHEVELARLRRMVAAYEVESAELRYFLGEQSQAAAGYSPAPGKAGAASHPKPGAMIVLDSPEELNRSIKHAIIPTSIVLDIGSGIRPMTFFRPDVHVCVEPYGEYVEVLQSTASRQPHLLVIRSDALGLLRLLPDKSVDSVFLIDVIEHFQKTTGLKILTHCERVARRQIAIFTPLGMHVQEYGPDDRDAWGLSGAAWQRHFSGWVPGDFGDEWSFLICDRYHAITTGGPPTERKNGAFWAVRTLTETARSLPSPVLLISMRLPPAQATDRRWQVLWRLLAEFGSEHLVCVTSAELAEFSAHLHPHSDRLPSPYHYVSLAATPAIEPDAGWALVASAVPPTVTNRLLELIAATGAAKIVVLLSDAVEAAAALSVAEVARIPVEFIRGESPDLSTCRWFREQAPRVAAKVITLDEAVDAGRDGLRAFLENS